MSTGVDELKRWRARGRMTATTSGEVFVVDVPAQQENGRDPLLVLHGFPTCSADWRHVVDTLATQRRVVLFDFVGFGLSAKPDRRYSIELHADTAVEVAASCGLERVALCTHDMGDTVGGELLARDLDGSLPFGISRRVLTNGSISLGLAHLTTGQQLLLQLDDAATDAISAEGFTAGVALTFSPAHPWRAKTHLGKAAAKRRRGMYRTSYAGRSPLQRLLANGEAPLVSPTSEKLNVLSLSEKRDAPGGLFQHPVRSQTECPAPMANCRPNWSCSSAAAYRLSRHPSRPRALRRFPFHLQRRRRFPPLTCRYSHWQSRSRCQPWR